MRITSSGQITIPRQIRMQLGFLPGTEVEFEITEAGILIRKKNSKSFGKKIIDQLRGRSDAKMTTDQIMALTRG